MRAHVGCVARRLGRAGALVVALRAPKAVLHEPRRVSSWPAGWACRLGRRRAPFREALGGALAFEAFAQAVDSACVLRYGVAAAIASFRKGSTRPRQMQRCALRLDRAAALMHAHCLPYHIQGHTLVAEGVDGASRGGADFREDVNCPADSIIG